MHHPDARGLSIAVCLYAHRRAAAKATAATHACRALDRPLIRTLRPDPRPPVWWLAVGRARSSSFSTPILGFMVVTPMTELPAGTVTFLFTDIEGSTRLLRELGDRYAEVLINHRRLLREAFGQFSGREVGTQGDSFFVAFRDASDAIRAAAAAQRALAAHSWPGESDVRVRMGIHTGEPLIADRLLRRHRRAPGGPNRRSRLGGQVLLSARTSALLRRNGAWRTAPSGRSARSRSRTCPSRNASSSWFSMTSPPAFHRHVLLRKRPRRPGCRTIRCRRPTFPARTRGSSASSPRTATSSSGARSSSRRSWRGWRKQRSSRLSARRVAESHPSCVPA